MQGDGREQVNFTELRAIAGDLERLGMRRTAARLRRVVDDALADVEDESTAPLQDDTRQLVRIPWGLHELAWKVYDAHGHGSQSAERLAERGGFARGELGSLLVGLYGNDRRHGVPVFPALDLYEASKR